MKTSISAIIIFLSIPLLICIEGCSGHTNKDVATDTNTLSQQQESLIDEGWYFPKDKPSGELSKEYGVKISMGNKTITLTSR